MDIVGPVASKLDDPQDIDWITEVASFDDDEANTHDRKLTLIGGCDLLQVSFYCGNRRDEYVNKEDENGWLVRYDDPNFITMPREPALKGSNELKDYIGWTYDDLLALDESLATSDIVLLSMFMGTMAPHTFSFGGKDFGGRYHASIPPRRMNAILSSRESAMRFIKRMFSRKLSLEDMVERTQQSLELAYQKTNPDGLLFLLSAATKTGEKAARSLDKRHAFNEMVKAFCHAHTNAIYVDLDEIIPTEDFDDSDHYTRTGYFKIAEFVNSVADQQANLKLSA